VFGSYGWNGGGTKAAHEVLQTSGLEFPLEDLQVQYIPNEEERKKCQVFGQEIGRRVKAATKG